MDVPTLMEIVEHLEERAEMYASWFTSKDMRIAGRKEDLEKAAHCVTVAAALRQRAGR